MTSVQPLRSSHPEHPLLEKLLIKLRNSRFFTISLLIHLLIVTALGSIVLFRAVAPPEDFVAGGGGGGGFVGPDTLPPGPPPASTDLTQPEMQVTTPVVQTPTEMMDVLTTVSSSPSAFSIDVAPVVAPSVNASAVAQRIPWAATGGGGGISGLPGILAGRSGAMRERARQRAGGTDRAEVAVMNGLRWLMRNQNADGTWGGSYRGAMTGLALLCFLGHGETYTSVEFGQTVKRAVDALVKSGEVNDGRLNGASSFQDQNSPYEHGIATYALAEAYTMTKDERIVPVLTRAVAYIVQAQTQLGGWHYRYARGDSNDLSVAGWQIQALKATQLTGLNLPGVDKAMQNAMGFLRAWQDPKTGMFGYQSREGRLSLTGTGAICLMFGTGRKTPEATAAIRAILDAVPSINYHSPDGDLYAWYYHTLACYQAQGSAWNQWNKRFQSPIIDAQSPDGSWPVMSGERSKNIHGGRLFRDATPDGAVYRTTLSVLMLEVFYRFLPTGGLHD